MLLTCPSCTVSYELPIDLPEGGRKVRCAKCAHVWIALPEDPTDPNALEDSEMPAPTSKEPEEQAKEPAEEAPDEPVEQPVEDVMSEIMDEGLEIDAQPPEIETHDDISFQEEETPGADDSLDAAPEEPEEEITEEDQAAIDALLNGAPADDEPNDQGGVDALFDTPTEPEVDDEPNDQGGVDALFDTPADDEPNDQGGVDALFDTPAGPEVEEEPNDQGGVDALFDTPEPEPIAEPPQVEIAPAPQEVASVPAAAEPAQMPPPQPQTPEQKWQATLLAAGWGGLVACIIGFGVISYFSSETVVDKIPGAAKIYDAAGVQVNVRGLEFRGVSYSWEAEAGQPVLHVKGSVINVTNKTLTVPKIVFALRDDKGAELFHWSKNVYREPLSAGQSAGFTARIPSPPTSVRSLQVRFAKAGSN